MQYRKSPLLPDPTPRPNGLASVVAVTVNVVWPDAEVTDSPKAEAKMAARKYVPFMIDLLR